MSLFHLVNLGKVKGGFFVMESKQVVRNVESESISEL